MIDNSNNNINNSNNYIYIYKNDDGDNNFTESRMYGTIPDS